MRRTVVVSIVLLLAQVTPAVGDADRIMLRATSVLPDPVGEELLKIGRPLDRTVRPGESVESELQANCGGSISNQYRAAFVKLNSGPAPLLPSTERRDMFFPPCPRVQRNVTISIQPGDNPNDLLTRELGAKSDTRLLICQPDTPNGNRARAASSRLWT
jgi:hypothetical protein